MRGAHQEGVVEDEICGSRATGYEASDRQSRVHDTPPSHSPDRQSCPHSSSIKNGWKEYESGHRHCDGPPKSAIDLKLTEFPG